MENNVKDLIQEGRKIQEAFKKNVISEGKWKHIDYDEGDNGWTRTWEYSPSFFDMIGNFLKGRSGKLPKIKSITATLEHNTRKEQEFTLIDYEVVKIKIVLGNPITIEKERVGSSDFYDLFDTILVTSSAPFTSFGVETLIRNKKNSDNINDVELNKLIKKMLEELKPELKKYTK